MIKLIDVSKKFKENIVLKNITVTFNENEAVCILGSSGSGKSTLLRLINHLETLEQGEIYIDEQPIVTKNGYIKEKDIALLCRPVGMIFQQFNLFPHINVQDNITLALKEVLGMSKQEAEKIAAFRLEQVNLTEKLHAYPDSLSGGQKQRVAIARALALNPKYLLVDEATSSLDPENVGEVLKVLKQLANDGMTLIIVTHEMEFAKSIAQRILFLDEGEILYDGIAKEFFECSNNERIERFLNA